MTSERGQHSPCKVCSAHADDGSVYGLDSDYASLHKDDRDDADQFALHLTQIMKSSMGAAAIATVYAETVTVNGTDVARVHVKPSGHPVEATITIDKSGQNESKTAFYARIDADPGGWLTVCLGCEAWDDGRSDPRRRGYEREEAAAFVDAG